LRSIIPSAFHDANEKTCPARPADTYFSPPKSKTILDAITISERWSNLRIAWFSYLDFTTPNVTRSRERFDRRQTLDQAIADYIATPSVSNIAGDMVQAWSKLTDLSYGCLTGDETFAALSAFASNANDVLAAAQKVSDAKDKFDSAIAPSATATKAAVGKKPE
jgi:hypothetical protein